MTPEEIENERKKLFANWCNTLATAVLTAGTLVPAAPFFGALPNASTTLNWLRLHRRRGRPTFDRPGSSGSP